MCRIWFIISVVGLIVACHSRDAIYLSPKAFQEACGTVVAAEADNGAAVSNAPPKLITVGMQISVTVGEDASLNRTYPVTPNCTLDISAVGRMKVCGLTTDELAGKIKTALERDYFTHATVTVVIEGTQSGGGGNSYTNSIVYVLGEVGRPGPLQLPAGDEQFTLTKTIVAAGGFTTFARANYVRVIRYCGEGRKYETHVDVERIMKNGDFEDDLPLRPNDWVIVPQKYISFW